MTRIKVDAAIDQTIVIIDDEDEIRTLMELALARPGRAVVSFADSSKALEYLRDDRQVDAIISDVRMAGMDGYTLVQRLQERSDTSGTPVIFVSANDAADHRLAQVGLEIEFLRKPFDIAELRARVDAAVSRRSAPVAEFEVLLAEALARAGEGERPMSLLLVATAPPMGALPAPQARSAALTIRGVVRAHLRRSDDASALARYACAATLDGCPPDRAAHIARTIADDLHARRDVLGIDVHVGLACAKDCRELTMSALVSEAETAVREAAASGRKFAMRELAT